MDLIKNKWNNFRVNRKLNQLWTDYKQVSHLQDDPETLNKLNLFLDQTKTVLKNYIESHNNKEQIDGFISDGQEVFNKMMDFIQNYDSALEKNQNIQLINEILEKSLELAEFILREPKFRKQIENSSKLLNELLNLVEKVENSESKIIIIKFLVIITENTDSKLFFAQQEGFSKMLNLLVQGDENIQQVISRALLHFLQTEKATESQFLNSLQNNMNVLEQQEFNTIKSKFHKLAYDIKKFTFGEIQRVFLNNNSNLNNQQFNQNFTPPQKRKGSENDNFSPNHPVPKTIQIQIPEADVIFKSDLKILMILQNETILDSTNDEENEQQQQQLQQNNKNQFTKYNNDSQIQQQSSGYKNNDQQYNIQNQLFQKNNQNSSISNNNKQNNEEYKNNIECNKQNYQQQQQQQFQTMDGQNQNLLIKKQISDQDDQQVLKKFVILKGGLKAIFEKIEEATDEIQIDLMGTIAKLFNNNDQQYKLEFKKLNGYTLLDKLFNTKRNYNDENNLTFILNLFEFLEIMMTNNKDKEIQNFDAFNLLLKLMSTSDDFELVSRALEILIKLFQINWKNLIIARRLKIMNCLINLISRIHKADVFLETAQEIRVDNQIYCYQKSQDSEELLPEDIHQEQFQQLLFQIQEIFIMYCQVEGFYSVEFETATTNMILKMLSTYPNIQQMFEIQQQQQQQLKKQQQQLQQQEQDEETEINLQDSQLFKNNNKNKQCCEFLIELLFGIIERKMQKKCLKIFSIDNNIEKVVQNFTQLFYHFILETNSSLIQRMRNFLSEEQKITYFIRLMDITHNFLSCSHKNEIYTSEINFEKSKQNLFLQNIINRNICRDIQHHLRQLFKKHYSTSNFILALQNQNLNQYQHYNLQILIIFKDLLILEEEQIKEFFQKEGLTLLTYLIQNFVCSENDHEILNLACNIFIDLATNINQSQKILTQSIVTDIPQIQSDQLQPSDKKMMVKHRLQSIISLFVIITNKPNNLNDQFYLIFDQIHRLQQNKENMKLIKNETNFFQFVLEFLTAQSNSITPVNNNLYTSLLSLFDIYINQLSADELDLCLDYILNSENLKKCSRENVFEIQFLVDCFSLLGVHMLLNTNPNILEKFISAEYILGLFGFLEVSNYSVREMAMRLIFVIFQLKNQSKKKDNFPKNKYFFRLLHKLVEQSPSIVNEGLCQTIYDLIFWTPDRIHIIFPSNSSVVSTILNRSEQGSTLIKKQKMIENQKLTNTNNNVSNVMIMQNVELLEILFLVMKSYQEGEDYKHQLLKILECQIDVGNSTLLLDQQNLLLWFYCYVKPIQQLSQEVETEKIPSHKKIYDILLDIIENDLKKPKSKIVEMHFKKFHEEIVFLIILIKRLLIKIIENPSFLRQEQQNIQMQYLKNFTFFLQSIEDVIGINQQINILTLQCINKLASQNDGKFRTYMKELKLFEIRDGLLIDILRYKIDGETLMQVLEGISFESLSKLSKFRDSKAVASLIKNLIEHKNHQNLQIVTIKILKHDVAVHEEYQKYAAKIIQQNEFIIYFYPNLVNKKSSLAKCLSSYKTQEEAEQSSEEEEEQFNKPQLQQQQLIGQQQQQQLQQQEEQKQEKELQQQVQYQQFVPYKGPYQSTDQFLQFFHSSQMEYERKQIMLRIDKELITVEQDSFHQQAKLMQKISKRKQQLIEAFSNEKAKIYKEVNKLEIEMNQKLIKSNEKFTSKHLKFIDTLDRKLQEGEFLYGKLRETQQ